MSSFLNKPSNLFSDAETASETWGWDQQMLDDLQNAMQDSIARSVNESLTSRNLLKEDKVEDGHIERAISGGVAAAFQKCKARFAKTELKPSTWSDSSHNEVPAATIEMCDSPRAYTERDQRVSRRSRSPSISRRPRRSRSRSTVHNNYGASLAEPTPSLTISSCSTISSEFTDLGLAPDIMLNGLHLTHEPCYLQSSLFDTTWASNSGLSDLDGLVPEIMMEDQWSHKDVTNSRMAPTHRGERLAEQLSLEVEPLRLLTEFDDKTSPDILNDEWRMYSADVQDLVGS